MSLDLTQTATQLYGAAPQFAAQRSAKLGALAQAVTHLQAADANAIEQRRIDGHSTWLVARPVEPMTAVHGAPPLPADHVVVAVDGSHIDVDRHSPARCFLINIGYVTLRYGEVPDAELRSTPHLFVGEDQLAIHDPASIRETAIEGPVLGAVRAVMELEGLVEAVEAAPPDLPLLALLDGSLIMWELAGPAFPDYVRKALLERRFLTALDRLHAVSQTRMLAVASQISLPRSADVVNALRISEPVCGFPQVNCDAHCGQLRRGARHCDVVGGVTDAELFDSVLRRGERSPMFESTSSVVAKEYGQHAVRFCYVHLGEEVCRLEMPEWCASGDAVDLAHAGVLSQAEKGHGYPLAVQEAHEQAVVNGADRLYFAQLVEEMLAAEGLPTGTSQKSRSKRTRFV